MKLEKITYILGFAFVGVMLVAFGLLFLCAPETVTKALPLGGLTYASIGTASLAAMLLLSALGAIVIIKMALGTIDLQFLVADEHRMASLSRFQMLLFTFVIGALYFLYSLYALLSVKSGDPSTACISSVTDMIKLTMASNTEFQAALKAANAASADMLAKAASAQLEALKAAAGQPEALAKAMSTAAGTLTQAAASSADTFSKAASASADALTKATASTEKSAVSLKALCSGALGLPEIPGSVLGLIGISGGSYLLSKGISVASNPAPAGEANPPIRTNNQ
jgi:hypothetical protein